MPIGISLLTITVAGKDSPGPKLSDIISNAFTESYLLPISSKELNETEPLYTLRKGTIMIANISSAIKGLFNEKFPTVPHSLLGLCSSEPFAGQNITLPKTAIKNGTSVTKASINTATPTATATAERYKTKVEKPMEAKPTNTAKPEINTVFPAVL
ncbi:hypothetical protein D3C73_800220 [compost metagenome]